MKKKVLTLFLAICLAAGNAAVPVSTFAADDKTMTNKKWISGVGGAYVDEDKDGKIESYEPYDTQYYKIKIPKQGYIMVDAKLSPLAGKQAYIDNEGIDDEEGMDYTDESLSITILNSKKKELTYYSSDDTRKKNQYRFSWAVKRGTYYLAVMGNANYKLRYAFTQVKKVSRAGKTMKKAVTLKRGKTVKNLLFYDNKNFSGHFYKLNVPKDSKVVVACNSKLTGNDFSNLFVQIYVKRGGKYRQVNTKGKLIPKDSVEWYGMEGKDSVSFKLSKGTYYLRALSISGSGYYTLKWK